VDGSSKLIPLTQWSGAWCVRTPGGPTEHKFWDIGFGEGRLMLGPLTYLTKSVETI